MEAVSNCSPVEHLRYAYGLLIGQIAELRTIKGEVFEGILHSIATKEQKIVLKTVVPKYSDSQRRNQPTPFWACSRKPKDSLRTSAQENDCCPGSTLVIDIKDIASLVAKSVNLNGTPTVYANASGDNLKRQSAAPTAIPGLSNKIASNNSRRGFMTDTAISAQRRSTALHGRELEAWVPPEDSAPMTTTPMELGRRAGKWDQFEVNREKFGIVAHFDEELYTTPLDRNSADYKRREREAIKIARDIEMSGSSNPHVLEERNRVPAYGEDGCGGYLDDDEAKYGAVIRDQENWRSGNWRSRKNSTPKPVNSGFQSHGAMRHNYPNADTHVVADKSPPGKLHTHNDGTGQRFKHTKATESLGAPNNNNIQNETFNQHRNKQNQHHENTQRQPQYQSVQQKIQQRAQPQSESNTSGKFAQKMQKSRTDSHVEQNAKSSSSSEIAKPPKPNESNKAVPSDKKAPQETHSVSSQAPEADSGNFYRDNLLNGTVYYPPFSGTGFDHRFHGAQNNKIHQIPSKYAEADAIMRDRAIEMVKEYTEKIKNLESFQQKSFEAQVSEMPSFYHFSDKNDSSTSRIPINQYPVINSNLTQSPNVTVSALNSPILGPRFLIDPKNFEAELELLVATEKSKQLNRMRKTVESFKEFSENLNTRPKIQKSYTADFTPVSDSLRESYSTTLETNAKAGMTIQETADNKTGPIPLQKNTPTATSARNEIKDHSNVEVKAKAKSMPTGTSASGAIALMKNSQPEPTIEKMDTKKSRSQRISEKSTLEPIVPFNTLNYEKNEGPNAPAQNSVVSVASTTALSSSVALPHKGFSSAGSGPRLQLNRDAPEFIPSSMRQPAASNSVSNKIVKPVAAAVISQAPSPSPPPFFEKSTLDSTIWPRSVFRSHLLQQIPFDFENHRPPPAIPAYNLPTAVARKPTPFPIHKPNSDSANSNVKSAFTNYYSSTNSVGEILAQEKNMTSNANSKQNNHKSFDQSKGSASAEKQIENWETNNQGVSYTDVVHHVYILPKYCIRPLKVNPQPPQQLNNSIPITYGVSTGYYPPWQGNPSQIGTFIGPDGCHYSPQYMNRFFPPAPPPVGVPLAPLAISNAKMKSEILAPPGLDVRSSNDPAYVAMPAATPAIYNPAPQRQFSNQMPDESNSNNQIDVTYPPPQHHRGYTNGYYNMRGRGGNFRNNNFRKNMHFGGGYRQNASFGQNGEGEVPQEKVQHPSQLNQQGFSYPHNARYGNRTYHSNQQFNNQNMQMNVHGGSHHPQYHQNNNFRGGRGHFNDQRGGRNNYSSYNKPYHANIQQNGQIPQPEYQISYDSEVHSHSETSDPNNSADSQIKEGNDYQQQFSYQQGAHDPQQFYAQDYEEYPAEAQAPEQNIQNSGSPQFTCQDPNCNGENCTLTIGNAQNMEDNHDVYTPQQPLSGEPIQQKDMHYSQSLDAPPPHDHMPQERVPQQQMNRHNGHESHRAMSRSIAKNPPGAPPGLDIPLEKNASARRKGLTYKT